MSEASLTVVGRRLAVEALGHPLDSGIEAVASREHRRGLVTLGVSATGGIGGTTGYFAGKVDIGATKPQHTLDVSSSLRAIGTNAAPPVADFITSATFNATTIPYGLRV